MSSLPVAMLATRWMVAYRDTFVINDIIEDDKKEKTFNFLNQFYSKDTRMKIW